MYINSILFIEATFVNITFQSKKQEELNETLSVRLSYTRDAKCHDKPSLEWKRKKEEKWGDL